MTVLAVVSGLFFVAVLAAWIRGHWRGTYLEWIPADETSLTRVSWGDGGVGITRINCRPTNDPSETVGWSVTTDAITPNSASARERYWKSVTVHFRRLGFAYGTVFDNESGYFEYYFEMPFWPLLALTLMLPAVKTLQLWRARNRGLAGRCPRCGYDLRASAGRCPECGEAITAHSRGGIHEAPV